MTEETREIASPSPFTLAVLYAVIVAYGVTASVFGVLTIRIVGGVAWEFAWTVLLVLAALAAATATLLSHRARRRRWEIIATLAVIALLIGYTIAIPIRTMFDGNVGRLPVAWLPVALSVFPFARLLVLSRLAQRAR